MFIKVSKKAFIKTVSFMLAIITVLSGFAISGYYFAKSYKNTLEYTYLRALNDLSDYISNLENTFTKGLYASTTSEQYNICAKIMCEASGAENALAQMPIEQMNLIKVSKFISQTGDFATYLLSNISKGNKLSDSEIQSIKALYNYSKIVNESIKEITSRFSDGSLKITKSPDFSKTMLLNTNESEPYISKGFKQIDDCFTDYPALIYDGPFSDHIMQMEPKLLKNKDDISINDAKNIACSFLKQNCNAVTFVGETGGNLQTYNFSSDSKSISVTKKGGYINYFLDSSANNNLSEYNVDEIIKSANDFLLEHNILNMTQSYYIVENGICTINYAFTSNDITFYSDLIKIGVDVNSKRIVSFNATGYIMNHTNRNIPKDLISFNNAQSILNSNLSVKDHKLCIIPTNGHNEVLCYEFLCDGEDDDKVLVYINAQTGTEEQIFILLQSDAGTLVM